MPVVREIGKVPVDIHDKPRIPVVIVDCGEVDDPRNFLRVPFDSKNKINFSNSMTLFPNRFLKKSRTRKKKN